MELILNTKLHVPPLRPGLMPRARLIERLDEGCHAGCRLILVSAPPGYGKTTLLSEWARGRQVAWLTLDEGDMGLVLPNADVSTLVARTKGWAAGLQMAALSLQAQPDQAALVQAFGGSHRYIFDYLLEEVLSHQPVGVQEFLLKTSILERLTAPLCDAVIQEEEKEGLPVRPFSDSQTALEYLERANLFLVPLDDGR